MSKKDATNTNGIATPELNEATTKKVPDVEKLKKLFADYAKVHVEYEKMLAAAEVAKGKVSEVVAKIHAEGGTGPYNYKGDQLTISKRGETYFFRGRGKTDSIEVG